MGLWDFLADTGQARVPLPPAPRPPMPPEPPPTFEEHCRRTIRRQLELAAGLWQDAATAAEDGNRVEVEALLAAADKISEAARKAMDRVIMRTNADRAARALEAHPPSTPAEGSD